MKYIEMPGWKGPVSTRSGTRFPADPDEGTCEVCEDPNPTLIVQGETDSFGAEYILCCVGCANRMDSGIG